MSDKEERPKGNRDRGRNDRGARGGAGNNIRDRSKDRGSTREPKSMKPSQTRVYVSNIPYEHRWQDVKDLFRNEVGDVKFVELFVDDSDKSKGSGIVEFSDQASVIKCMEVMQRYDIRGRKLVIKEDIGVTRDKHGVIISGTPRRVDRSFDRRDINIPNISMRNDDGKWGNTYGLSAEFLESLNIDPPIGNKIFVANLDYKVDEKKVRDAFKLAGRLIAVDVPVDKDGRIRGFAVVEYDHPVEAVQAISMFHGQSFFDRVIAVRMDRASDNIRLPDGLRSIGMGLGPNGEPLKCVAHNLPSLASNTQQDSSVNNGILGAVPNNSLQFGALSGLGNIGTLNALQAANLTSLLGAADLSALVANSAAQQQLAALAAQNTSSNLPSGNPMSNYNRSGGGVADDYGSGSNFGGGGGDYRQSGSNQGYNAPNNNETSNRAYKNAGSVSDYGNGRLSFSENNSNSKSFSKKVILSNLPSSVSYKLLSQKCSEFGDVQSFEAKGPGSIMLTYATDWQAEKAIKNLDKARIDGRMIDARLFF